MSQLLMLGQQHSPDLFHFIPKVVLGPVCSVSPCIVMHLPGSPQLFRQVHLVKEVEKSLQGMTV